MEVSLKRGQILGVARFEDESSSSLTAKSHKVNNALGRYPKLRRSSLPRRRYPHPGISNNDSVSVPRFPVSLTLLFWWLSVAPPCWQLTIDGARIGRGCSSRWGGSRR